MRQCLLLALYLHSRKDVQSAIYVLLLSSFMCSSFFQHPGTMFTDRNETDGVYGLVSVRGLKELGSSLPDGVASPETNPLRYGTVLLLSFGKLLLGAERLVALFVDEKIR